ncbi:NADP-dependent oxidoreductase domain-containing protein 1 [Embiotoca jacksoni]|uniref:NADP-dependent oxidoreductase domain-containing protein 1 n=1 Tax=Embiotoca jacksoni TaxID=100190 RepID=UPI0037039CC3
MMMMMMDITADLSSMSFEVGLTGDEKKLLYLRARAAGMTFCGCAHAAFTVELAHLMRCAIKSHTANGDRAASGADGDLRVGVLGMGNLGRQLLLTLLEKTSIKPSQTKISTRRPESAGEFTQKGVECFFDNRRLGEQADLLFLCCLPSQLPKVCADLHAHLSERCLVYSFTTGVPVARLARLLGHDNIIKPQYDFVDCDDPDVWLSCSSHPAAARTDPVLIEASRPLTMKGGISLGLNWTCALLYSLLNTCTSASLGSSEALALMNSIFKEQSTNTSQFNSQSFISSSCAFALRSDEPFPWISLRDAQTRTTPLQRFLSSSKSLQQFISAAYKSQLETQKEELLPNTELTQHCEK